MTRLRKYNRLHKYCVEPTQKGHVIPLQLLAVSLPLSLQNLQVTTYLLNLLTLLVNVIITITRNSVLIFS